MKIHYRKHKGFWKSYYYRGCVDWSLPITVGFTLKECYQALVMYRPELLKVD